MAKLRLISFPLCPYVQRAAILLLEKGVEFERVDIDLANKPDWFLKLSPLGKVPVLVVEQDGREQVLFESAWRRALGERPSVRNAVVADFQDRRRDYVREKGGYLGSLTLAAV